MRVEKEGGDLETERIKEGGGESEIRGRGRREGNERHEGEERGRE